MSSLYDGYGSIKDQLTEFIYEDDEKKIKKEHTKEELQAELEGILQQVDEYELKCATKLGWR